MITNTRLRFALAGRIVSKSNVARKIEFMAITNSQFYLVDQARNVRILLSRAGQ